MIVFCDKLVDLEPRYDSAKSFYGKATIAFNPNKVELISYTTRICNYSETTKMLQFNPSFQNSRTTRRHVWEFIHFVEDECGAYNLTGVCQRIMRRHKIKSFRQFCDEIEYVDLARNVFKKVGDQYSIGI